LSPVPNDDDDDNSDGGDDKVDDDDEDDDDDDLGAGNPCYDKERIVTIYDNGDDISKLLW
jgi:hypothetical protein